MDVIEQAEELRQRAISLLVEERSRIDAQLNQLGYGQENAPTGKRRGRRPKGINEQEALALGASHS